MVLLAGNLREVRQADALFAAPTYAFIVAIAALVIAGLVHAAGRGFHPAPVPHLTAVEGVSVLLVLRAFSSGATAMTGIEAISNAVPAFKPVEWRNARITLSWMVGLLIAMFAGVLANRESRRGSAGRSSQTMLSPAGAPVATAAGLSMSSSRRPPRLVLLLAANTAYNDFPRVMFLLARDHLAPRSFLHIGDRLAFTNGTIALSLMAASIYAAFGGDTESLIPLYAVGVFLAFTLSQAGMVIHWLRRRNEAHWRKSLLFNAIGAMLSAVVFLIAAITKFAQGAWLALFAIALFMVLALRIRRHYDLVAEAVALRTQPITLPMRPLRPPGGRRAGTPVAEANGGETATQTDEQPTADVESEEYPEEIHHLMIVPIAGMNLASMRALAYAASLGQPLLALHISPTDEEAKRFRRYWEAWGDHLPLEIVVSPHRAIVAPMINYIESLRGQRPELTLTAILPEIIGTWWHRLLHNQTVPRVRRALRPLPKIIVTTVPFHLPSRR